MVMKSDKSVHKSVHIGHNRQHHEVYSLCVTILHRPPEDFNKPLWDQEEARQDYSATFFDYCKV